jgi:heme/copper-type cytochrome/quinol oxidase subunit 3
MEIPHEVTPRRDTGLYNAKLGIWLFLASEVMLFGGLFSAYVFLRLGVRPGFDSPWPLGMNVHGDFVWLGFINTLVLIASSVGVVFAWVALKERKWRLYQIYMYFVIACAVVFMCIKLVEYNSKLNHHFGIKLKDNSVMEGALAEKGGDRIHFEGSKVSFSFTGALPGFLSDLVGDEFPVFIADPGPADEGPVELKSYREFAAWFHNNRRKVNADLASERKRYRSEAATGATPKPVSVNTAGSVSTKEGFAINGNPRKVVSHSEKSMNYRDGIKIEGKLLSDDVKYVVHQVDMQLVLPQKQRDSMVWEVIADDAAKQNFFAAQATQYQKLQAHYGGKPIPEGLLRGSMLNLHEIHGDDAHGGGHAGDHAEKEAGPASEVHVEHGDAAAEHGEHVISVPRDKIKFMSNHGPRYGNYYAIYFTMTALHGLHVIGGALVLLFFTVFGKKLYLKNPEHLANRVEVGGLFWHFVDLVWIFLFPIMYLF